MIEPVRPISLGDIEAARRNVAGMVLKTPLVRIELGPNRPEIYLKLENLQPTNAYKIRGAANAMARLSDEERDSGVWTISAGNAGQGVAYAARAAGIPCSVVAIETAPQTKLERMRALGATIIPVSYEEAWRAAETHSFDGVDGKFIHPFDNHDFIAGHGTMGLEIVEQLPEVSTVIAAIGGGGLITGVGSAVKALRPDVKILGAEPETAAPYAYSLEQGTPLQISGLASIVRRRRRRPKRHRTDVAADAPDRRWRDHRLARSDERGDAPDRRKDPDDIRGGRRLVACCRARRSGQATSRSSASSPAATSTLRSSPNWWPDQRPSNWAGRFSRNAATPSR